MWEEEDAVVQMDDLCLCGTDLSITRLDTEYVRTHYVTLCHVQIFIFHMQTFAKSQCKYYAMYCDYFNSECIIHTPFK